MSSEEEYQEYLKLTGLDETFAKQDRSTFRKISTVTNFLGDVAIGGAVGTVETGIKDVTEMAYDLGKEVDYGLSRAFSFLTDETKEQTQARIDSEREDLKKWRDGNLNYISALKDESSEVQKFSSEFFSSVAKYSLVWSRLPKAWGVVKKSTTAGAVEGATDSPDRELLLFDEAFIGMAGLFGEEDAVKDYLDVSKPRSQTQRNLHRALSSMEIAMLSAGGEAAVMKAAPALKKGAEAAKEFVGESVEKLGQKAGAMIPDKAKEKLIDGYAAVLDKHRAAKEWLAKKARGDTIDFSKHVKQAGDDGVELVEGQLRFNFDATRTLATPKDFNDKLAALEKRLEELAPSIDTQVVNLKNAKRLSDEEALESILGDVGRGANEAFRKEGLKGVLRVVASNAILDQETVKMAAVLSARSAKPAAGGTPAVTVTQVRDSIKGYLLAAEQREAILKAPARAMRAAQEVMDGTQAIYSQVREETGGLVEAMKKFGGDLDNATFLDEMADTLENILSKNQILGKSDDEVIHALLTHVDRTVKKKGKAQDFLESLSSMYQANLLSGLPTHAQNITGSFSRHMLMAFETGIEAGWNKAVGREAGDATFREAWYQTIAPAKAAFYGTLATGRMVATLAKGDFKGARAAAMHNMQNIPEMSQAQAAKMFRPTRQDFSADPQGWSSAPAAVMRGIASPVMGAINIEDTVQRSMTARGVLEGKFNTAIYVDNVLGLGEGVLKEGKAQKVINSLWKNQDYDLTPDDIKALGLTKTESDVVRARLEQFREKASMQAREAADEAVFQTPLTGAMKDVQTILQDRLLYGAGRVFTPFFTTPVNIVNDTLKRIPLIQMGSDGAMGLPVHPQFYRDFMAGGAKQKKAIARLTSGIAMTQYFMDMAADGHLQYVPSDPKTSEGLQGVLGMQPGSAVIGDKAYSLAFLGPIGIIANYAAYLNHRRELIETGMTAAPDGVKEAMQDMIILNLINFSYAVRELPWAMAIDQAARVLEPSEDDENILQKLEKTLAQKAGQLVPYSSMQRNIYNNIENDRVIAEGLTDHFKNQFMPYEGLLARNAFGETMRTTGGWLYRSTDINDDAVAQKAIRLGVKMPNIKVEQTFQGKKGDPMAKVALDRQEYERLGAILMDMNVRATLGDLMDSQEFRGNLDLGKAEGSRRNRILIQSAVESMHREALQRLLSESPNLQVKVESARKKGYDLEQYKPVTTATPTFQGVR